MATHEIPILGVFHAPDASGDVFFQTLEAALTLGTATLGNLGCYTMSAPTGADTGIYGNLVIPQNYAGTPVLVIRGYLGQAANTLAFGFQQKGLSASDSLDQAFEAEDTASNATWTGFAAEDLYEETITITPGSAYSVGDVVNWFFYRDDSVDTQTGEFHIASLAFRYSDT